MDDDNSSIHEIEIDVNGRSLLLSISDVNRMHVHEKIIPSLLDKIKKSIKKESVLIDPIVADDKIGLVIDGTHRLIALKELGYKLVLTLSLNYESSEIKLGRWYRVLRIPFIEGIVDKYGMREVEIDEVIDGLDNGTYEIGLISRRNSYCIGALPDITYLSRVVEEITGMSGSPLGFIPDHKIHEFIGKLDDEGWILGYRTLSKMEVLDSVRRGGVFTYKFTRHVIPIRLLSINIPIKLLEGHENIDRIIRHIRSLRFQYLGNNINIDDRIYEEDVYIGIL